MPSAELVHQQPLLWGAKTQWLLLGVCICMGARRKAQLGGWLSIQSAVPDGEGFFPPCDQPYSPSVLGTHIRVDILPMTGWGHGEDRLQGTGWEHTWHRLVPVAELWQPAWLTCLCTARRGCALLPSALCPLGFSREPPGTAAAEMSQKSTGNSTSISFLCAPFPSLCQERDKL